MEVPMLDSKFLRSLGIKEELLRPQPEPQVGERERDLPPVLPMAGARGLPAVLFSLNEAELEKLLKEEHIQGTPYLYCMPNGRQKAGVYPDKTLKEYDLEWPAKEFIFLVGLARNPVLDGMPVYKPRQGPWRTVVPNTSRAMMDFLLWLDDDRNITLTQSDRRQQHDV
jgi:hypothetical protein